MKHFCTIGVVAVLPVLKYITWELIKVELLAFALQNLVQLSSEYEGHKRQVRCIIHY